MEWMVLAAQAMVIVCLLALVIVLLVLVSHAILEVAEWIGRLRRNVRRTPSSRS